jgi:6-phosphogluconolactonase (cycloisomerase 2 family)
MMLAYVGSRTTVERQARGRGLSVYAVGPGATRWDLLQTVELVNPSYLLLTPDRQTLYVVHGDRSDVTSLAIEPDGRLHVLDHRPTRGMNPVHLELSADGRYLVVANYATGSLSSIGMAEDGALGDVVDTLRLNGRPGPHRVEQEGSHPHHVARWQGSNLFVVPDKGLDRIHLVRLTGEGRLEIACETEARSCSGPRHAAFDAERPLVWVCNELDSTVTTYHIDPAIQTLTARSVAHTLPSTFTGENRAAGIAFHPHSRAVYVSNRGHDSVCVLAAAEDGALSARQWLSTLGATPRFVTLSPDARQLFVANENGDSLVRFLVSADGTLGEGDTVARTGSPVCVVFLDPTIH